MGNIRGREGGSQRFSQEGWLVTLAGLIIARSEVEVNGKVWGFISLVRGQRPEAKCLGFHFLVNGGCGSWVDFWISTVNPRNRPLVPAPALLHTPRTSAMGPAPLSTGDRKSQTHTHLPRALGGPEVTGVRNKWS